MEELLSAQRHHRRAQHAARSSPIGTCETPEFQRQSRDFAAAVQAAGKPVELIVGEGYNHFELLETLANPYGLTGRAMLEQMKLMRNSNDGELTMAQTATVQRAEGPAGLARHGPEGARRRLRPDGLCAEPRPGAQAQHVQQRPRARAARRAEAARLRPDADRAARSVRDRKAERADQRVHPRRRLAAARGEGLRLHGRDVRARRRALDRARLRRRRGHQGRSAADGRSGAARAWPGSTRTPRASAAIRTASTSPASRPARISPATSSPPTGRSTACRRTS